LAFLFLPLSLSATGAEGATVKTISWTVPATYADQTAIPAAVRQTIETRLYYSLDRVAWTRFASVPGGGGSWTGTLPVADGISGYYAATATVPAAGIESPFSWLIAYPPPSAAADRFDEIDVALANHEDTFVAIGDISNYSTDPLIRAQVRSDGRVASRGFLKWDLSALPVGARVANATLRLHYVGEEAGGGDAAVSVKVAKVVGSDPDLGTANWDSPGSAPSWTRGRDGGAGNIETAEAAAIVRKNHGWVVWNVSSMVQDWLDTPGANYGMAIDPAMAGATGGNRHFASREHPDPRLRPMLAVTFLQPSLLPAPQGNPVDAPPADPAPGVSSDTFTVAVSPLADTFVNLGVYSDRNYSSEHLIQTYTWPANNVANRGFIRWDLSAIPENVTVTGATLWLYYAGEEVGGGDAAYTVSVSKVTGVLPDLERAAWNRYDGSSAWPGGKDGGASAMAPAESSATIGKKHRWVTWDVTSMVQEWVSIPGTDFGMALDADRTASADSNRSFASSEHPDPMLRPQLLVTFVRNP
jgi:hypothetical protein